MPLIPYPNVPNTDGVPPLSRRANQPTSSAALSNASSASSANVLTATALNSWQIVDSQGAAVITPDSVLQLEYRGESRVSSAPVEQGAFTSYNKVASPYDLHLVITCNGTGEMGRDDFLNTLNALANSTALCSVVTPDAIYADCNLVSFDYRRQSNNGATMIIAACYFQEIRQTAAAGLSSTKKADGADPVKRGATSAISPSSALAANLSSKEVM